MGCMVVEAPVRDPPRWATPLGWGLAGLAVGLVAVAVAAAVVGGWSLADAASAFLVTNAAMAVSFPLCGLILGARRPTNPIGWLFLADGLGHAVTAAAVPLITVGLAERWPMWSLRTMATAAAYSWPWSIGLFLPLALLLFPDGRPPGRRWRWLIWAAVVTAPLFVVEAGTEPSSPVPGGPVGYLTIGGHERFAPLWLVAELRVLLLYGAALVALVVRYRRGGERERRQLLWLVLATLVTLGVLVPWGVFLVGPALMLLAVPLIGVAVTMAILRHQLLDIRLVFSRTVVYLVLTGAVVLAYEVLVALLDAVLRSRAGLGTSVLATVLVALGVNPVRVRLQRLLNRVWTTYAGRPRDRPATRLAGAEGGLVALVESLRSALRLPFVALRDDRGRITASGTASETLHTIPLAYGTEHLGDLVVGMSPGHRRLDPAHRVVLELLAAPLSVAMLATALSEELHRSEELRRSHESTSTTEPDGS